MEGSLVLINHFLKISDEVLAYTQTIVIRGKQHERHRINHTRAPNFPEDENSGIGPEEALNIVHQFIWGSGTPLPWGKVMRLLDAFYWMWLAREAAGGKFQQVCMTWNRVYKELVVVPTEMKQAVYNLDAGYVLTLFQRTATHFVITGPEYTLMGSVCYAQAPDKSKEEQQFRMIREFDRQGQKTFTFEDVLNWCRKHSGLGRSTRFDTKEYAKELVEELLETDDDWTEGLQEQWKVICTSVVKYGDDDFTGRTYSIEYIDQNFTNTFLCMAKCTDRLAEEDLPVVECYQRKLEMFV
jgi:hypothetical protein